jgi:hypothetical protein
MKYILDGVFGITLILDPLEFLSVVAEEKANLSLYTAATLHS